MPNYSFKARNKAGIVESGEVSADNKRSALNILKDRGLFVSSINQKRFSFSSVGKSFKSFSKKLDSRDLAIWANQFQAMYTAGVPISFIITTLAQQTDNKKFRAVQQDILSDIKQGTQIGRSMEKHPDYFPELMVNMFKVGEEAGVMEESLDQIVKFYDQDFEMKQKLKTAMYYPIVILIMSIIVIWVLMTQMVPAFVQAYDELGGGLPLPTRILISVSDFLVNNGLLVLLMTLGVFFLGFIWSRTERGTKFFDFIGYKIPVLGRLKHLNSISRFCRIFSTLQGHGIDIITSLTLIERSLGSPVMGKAISNARDRVLQGQSMSQAFQEDKYYPPLVVNMLTVGEESGTVDIMMAKAASLYEMDVKNMSERVDKLLEPVINLGLAVIVGGILIAVIVPMFSMYSLIGE